MWTKPCCAPSRYVVVACRQHHALIRSSDSQTGGEEGEVPIRWHEYGAPSNAAAQAEEEGQQDGLKGARSTSCIWSFVFVLVSSPLSIFAPLYNRIPRPPFLGSVPSGWRRLARLSFGSYVRRMCGWGIWASRSSSVVLGVCLRGPVFYLLPAAPLPVRVASWMTDQDRISLFPFPFDDAHDPLRPT